MGGLAERRTLATDSRVKLKGMYEPPPELLKLDRADLEALRDALAKLRSAL
jgi:hypothetical protein